MELKTFDTILTSMCDYFDTLISPRTIARTNTNIIYLILKAISKGYEIINNVCVTLSNKFDPENCSVEDLDSVSSLVGTERLQGSDSGLYIKVTNTNETDSVILLAGTYTYEQSDDVSFAFDVLQDTVIEAQGSVTFIAMSDSIGEYPVTEQSDISVESDMVIPDDLIFSCSDNSNLLGTTAETDLEFRKRILEGYNGQDSMVELENTLKNLPYLFDCKVRFNNTVSAVTYDGVTVPPYYAVIFYSGEPKNEIASKIAGKLICPTVQTEDSVELTYESEVLLSGSQSYYIIPFKKKDFGVEIKYKVDLKYTTNSAVQSAMSSALLSAFVTQVHSTDYIRESDIYAVLDSINVLGLTIFDVNLTEDGAEVSYIEVPVSRVPNISSSDIVFTVLGD